MPTASQTTRSRKCWTCPPLFLYQQQHEGLSVSCGSLLSYPGVCLFVGQRSPTNLQPCPQHHRRPEARDVGHAQRPEGWGGSQRHDQDEMERRPRQTGSEHCQHLQVCPLLRQKQQVRLQTHQAEHLRGYTWLPGWLPRETLV